MREELCDVTNFCVRSGDMGKISVYDRILIENPTKSKDGDERHLCMKFHFYVINSWHI